MDLTIVGRFQNFVRVTFQNIRCVFNADSLDNINMLLSRKVTFDTHDRSLPLPIAI